MLRPHPRIICRRPVLVIRHDGRVDACIGQIDRWTTDRDVSGAKHRRMLGPQRQVCMLSADLMQTAGQTPNLNLRHLTESFELPRCHGDRTAKDIIQARLAERRRVEGGHLVRGRMVHPVTAYPANAIPGRLHDEAPQNIIGDV